MIDLRSDTVTVPCDSMRAAMASAEVGDDVIDVDPTTARLQARIAELTGHESAMFMPSGTMTNQAAIRLHCGRGDEFLCESGCHIFNYEQGGFAQLSQAITRCVDGVSGLLTVADLLNKIRPKDEHAVQTRLLCLENTHNRGGGRVLPYEDLVQMCNWAHENGLKTHLDGARLFNAVVATGIPADRWCQHFDTVSICFSKGLGAPVGSALVGSKSAMSELRRHRKLFGGGMRQSGIVAAGALFALENNIQRLSEDHANAQIIGKAIQSAETLALEPEIIDTNIVIFRILTDEVSAAEFCQRCKSQGVWMLPFSDRHVRAVTHLNVDRKSAVQAAEMIVQTANQLMLNSVD